MFGEIVLGLDSEALMEALAPKYRRGTGHGDAKHCFEALERAIIEEIAAQGEVVEADPHWQLRRAVAAVFESWDSRRACAYRAHHGIADDLGTAVTVQAMVFGNLDLPVGIGRRVHTRSEHRARARCMANSCSAARAKTSCRARRRPCASPTRVR